ncbi:MAG: hypothetical protein MRZ40_02185 [Ligilactobacillus animalis]|uniref:hypothetical protein n=1 Tax=Ligilactobacillus animalis TaxID=1605 RepID=UPI00242A7A9D|nr:hypothetical protein [Ligilactobacillus animalis]MCI5941361.1 hypothetical protein [Ligilactobacillus animalis]MDY2993137.1 hypothetical protein [Ligilactobacillus animalis]
MKKRVVLVLIAIFLVLAGIGGTKKVVEMRETAQKERQVAFLKAHEKEMTEYILKSESEEISEVEYIWSTVKVRQGMAFTKKGLSIKVNIFDNNGNKVNGFWINIFVDNVKNPSLIEGIN